MSSNETVDICRETSTPRIQRSTTVAGGIMTSTPQIQRSISCSTQVLKDSRPQSSSLTTLNSDESDASHLTAKTNLTISTVSDQVSLTQNLY